MIATTRSRATTELDPVSISPRPPLDIERFSSTLAALEFYVDGLVDEFSPSPMDRWTDDELVEIRLACL